MLSGELMQTGRVIQEIPFCCEHMDSLLCEPYGVLNLEEFSFQGPHVIREDEEIHAHPKDKNTPQSHCYGTDHGMPCLSVSGGSDGHGGAVVRSAALSLADLARVLVIISLAEGLIILDVKTLKVAF